MGSVGHHATLACILEATARKAGNVHPQARFSDVHYVDFVQSALRIGPMMEAARESGVGATILAAVRSCRDLVGTNTNLGMILLFAPLAAVPADQALAPGVSLVLRALERSPRDAALVYEAIRIARPGGLGRVAEQDVAVEPTVNLIAAMRLAADRDLIARQYTNGFAEVFGCGVPALLEAQSAGLNWEQSIIRCHLALMAAHPDTLIARKRGWSEADSSAARAAAVLSAGWPGPDRATTLFSDLDAWLRAVGHERNPGSTADLVAASLFVAMLDGRWTVGR